MGRRSYWSAYVDEKSSKAPPHGVPCTRRMNAIWSRNLTEPVGVLKTRARSAPLSSRLVRQTWLDRAIQRRFTAMDSRSARERMEGHEGRSEPR